MKKVFSSILSMKFSALFLIILFSNNLQSFATNYYIEGIGISYEINSVLHYPQLLGVIPNSPAYRANLAQGDLITVINGISTYNYTIDMVVEKLLGKKGTSVQLNIRRGNRNYPIKLIRDRFLDNDQSSRTYYIKSNDLPTFKAFTWTGNVVNNYADGYGTLRLINEDNTYGYSYVGYMKNGELNGTGIYYNEKGNKVYEGELSHNQFNGLGYKYYTDGRIQFEGQFVNDNFHIGNSLQQAVNDLALEWVNKYFHGGTNIYAKVTRQCRRNNSLPYSEQNLLMRIKVGFNGDINTNNYYEFVAELSYSPNGTDIEIVDINDMARGYLQGVKLAEFSYDAVKLYQTLDYLFN